MTAILSHRRHAYDLRDGGLESRSAAFDCAAVALNVDFESGYFAELCENFQLDFKEQDPEDRITLCRLRPARLTPTVASDKLYISGFMICNDPGVI